MIDKEREIFQGVSQRLHEKYSGIYVIGAELINTPPKFPAVSLVQTNNAVRSEFSTFDALENVVREDYKAEVFSNLEVGKEAQTKEISAVISEVMKEYGYERTFCEPIGNGDPTIHRRMSRYQKNTVI
jgi:hypothetical protein